MKAQRRRAKKDTQGKRAAANAKVFDLADHRLNFLGRNGVVYPVGPCGFVPKGCKYIT